MSTEPLTKSYLTVDRKRMAFHERGAGEPIVRLNRRERHRMRMQPKRIGLIGR